MRSPRFLVFAVLVLLLTSIESFSQSKPKKAKIHVNSIERIIYKFRGNLLTSLDGTSFFSLSKKAAKDYKDAVLKQKKSISKDLDHHMVPQFPWDIVTPNYPCSIGICPCSTEKRTAEFILIYNDSSQNSINLSIIDFKGDELKLQPKRQLFDNHPVQSFTINSSTFCRPGKSNLKVEKTNLSGRKESFYFPMRCDSARFEKPNYRYKGLLVFSNK